MKKKGLWLWGVLYCFNALAGSSLFAQQLTRFAVVDLAKVYTAFFRESQAVREFEERSALVQSDVDRMTAAIQALQIERLEAESEGDRQRVLRLESEIYRQSEFLREYFQIKTAELNEQRSRLTQSNAFLDQVLREIRFIAESEGYSMVLSLKESTEILWYSPSVDITDRLITNLLARAGR